MLRAADRPGCLARAAWPRRQWPVTTTGATPTRNGAGAACRWWRRHALDSFSCGGPVVQRAWIAPARPARGRCAAALWLCIPPACVANERYPLVFYHAPLRPRTHHTLTALKRVCGHEEWHDHHSLQAPASLLRLHTIRVAWCSNHGGALAGANKALVDATRRLNVDAMRRALEAGARPMCTHRGWTDAQWVVHARFELRLDDDDCKARQVAVLRLLAAHGGLDIDVANHVMMDALMHCCLPCVVQTLLEAGADVHHTDDVVASSTAARRCMLRDAPTSSGCSSRRGQARTQPTSADCARCTALLIAQSTRKARGEWQR